MNFRPELLAKVLDGTKTQTRRIVKPGHQLCISYAEGDFVIDSKMRVVYHVYRDYAACPGRGKFQQGRILITWISKQNVADITESDAIAEGFASRDEFFAAWDKINGKKARNAEVWVIHFQVAK